MDPGLAIFIGTVHGRKAVRWGVVGEIAMSRVLTLPATILFGPAASRSSASSDAC